MKILSFTVDEFAQFPIGKLGPAENGSGVIVARFPGHVYPAGCLNRLYQLIHFLE